MRACRGAVASSTASPIFCGKSPLRSLSRICSSRISSSSGALTSATFCSDSERVSFRDFCNEAIFSSSGCLAFFSSWVRERLSSTKASCNSSILRCRASLAEVSTAGELAFCSRSIVSRTSTFSSSGARASSTLATISRSFSARRTSNSSI